jgi:CRISPR-associated exonuclease Cas4
MPDPETGRTFYFTVTDLKQYQYCPRIIYFTYVQPVPRRITRLMEFGEMRHLEMERLEPRRVVSKYGLDEGEKVFRELLRSEKLGLTGKLDLAIHTRETIYPVEFKFTLEQQPRANYISQLAAYAMLLEEGYHQTVELGFFYLIPLKKIVSIAIKEDDKTKVTGSVAKMRSLIETETFPPATRDQGKCIDCEWRNFCGDIPLIARSAPVIGCFGNKSTGKDNDLPMSK